ncbi:MAG: hypothetical protein COA38_19835 [Fluviicola sp.]|nr:MAG: hypothetical protein COA38_19835 [Fluviicola sp.]
MNQTVRSSLRRSTRRHELAALLLEHLDLQRLVIIVQRGKGNKERRLPVGDCAAQWLEKYVNDVRDDLLDDVTERTLFLTDYGAPFSHNQVGQQVKKYLKQAEIKVTGSCHLLRHAMATHMLEHGADIRFIQAMLGHEDLNTTEIYTKVSVEKLREVHTATHPATIPVNEANAEES